jgi:hypothetical protein
MTKIDSANERFGVSHENPHIFGRIVCLVGKLKKERDMRKNVIHMESGTRKQKARERSLIFICYVYNSSNTIQTQKVENPKH